MLVVIVPFEWYMATPLTSSIFGKLNTKLAYKAAKHLKEAITREIILYLIVLSFVIGLHRIGSVYWFLK